MQVNVQKKQVDRPKSLENYLREVGFRGAFALKAKRSERGGIQLVPTSNDATNNIKDAFGLERLPFIFPVAAFCAKVGSYYNCLLNLREGARIMEAVPDEPNRTKLTQTGDWKSEVELAPRLVFTKDHRGRYSTRIDDMLILPLDLKILDTKTTFETGELSIRRAASRTFAIAGEARKVAATPERKLHGLEVYDGEKVKFSSPFAPQFKVLGRWLTAFELLGYPDTNMLQGIRDSREKRFQIAQFREGIEGMIAAFERWWKRIALPTVHPDIVRYSQIFSDISQTVVEEHFLRLWQNSEPEMNRAIDWLREWASVVVADRKLVLTIVIPEPHGRRRRVFVGSRDDNHSKTFLTALTQDELLKLIVLSQENVLRVEAEDFRKHSDKPLIQPAKADPEPPVKFGNQVVDFANRFRERWAASRKQREKTVVVKPQPKANKPAVLPTVKIVAEQPRAVTSTKLADNLDAATRARLEEMVASSSGNGKPDSATTTPVIVTPPPASAEAIGQPVAVDSELPAATDEQVIGTEKIRSKGNVAKGERTRKPRKKKH